MERSDAKQLWALEDENGKLRDERLNETLFGTLGDARKTLEEWQEDYNWEPSAKDLTPSPPYETGGNLVRRAVLITEENRTVVIHRQRTAGYIYSMYVS